jgi:hypothetical protein
MKQRIIIIVIIQYYIYICSFVLIAYWQPVASGKVSQSRQKTLPDAFERFSSCLAGQNWSAQLRVGSKPWRQAEHQKSQSYEWMCASPENSVAWRQPIYLVIQITYIVIEWHWPITSHHHVSCFLATVRICTDLVWVYVTFPHCSDAIQCFAPNIGRGWTCILSAECLDFDCMKEHDHICTAVRTAELGTGSDAFMCICLSAEAAGNYWLCMN